MKILKYVKTIKNGETSKIMRVICENSSKIVCTVSTSNVGFLTIRKNDPSTKIYGIYEEIDEESFQEIAQ